MALEGKVVGWVARGDAFAVEIEVEDRAAQGAFAFGDPALGKFEMTIRAGETPAEMSMEPEGRLAACMEVFSAGRKPRQPGAARMWRCGQIADQLAHALIASGELRPPARALISFELDAEWLGAQIALAAKARPGRTRRPVDRALFGLHGGALLVVFPFLDVSRPVSGEGEGWFSADPGALADIASTFAPPVRVQVFESDLHIGTWRASHGQVALSLGRSAPWLAREEEELDRLAAAAYLQARRRAAARAEAVDEAIAWHRASAATNTTPLTEHIREGSVVIYAKPGAPTPSYAVVEQRQHLADRVTLLCHDTRGTRISVDAAWVTHVGC